MPRMSVLNAEEKQAFDSPPVFNSVQRKQSFDVTPRIASTDALKLQRRAKSENVGFPAQALALFPLNLRCTRQYSTCGRDST